MDGLDPRREALRRALDKLGPAHAVDGGDVAGELWHDVRQALDALYRPEQAERAPDPRAFYRRRDAHPDGPVVAGLVWVRGLELHHQAEVQEAAWRAHPTRLARRRRRLHPVLDGHEDPHDTQPHPAIEVVLFGPVARWPLSSVLPRYTGHPNGDHREEYDQRVAERQLVPPLAEAARFFGVT